MLPTRLAFYEDWLTAEGLRGGTIGLASVRAVLSFLRQEGAAYDETTSRAGTYAAEWTIETMTPFERRSIARLPLWLRRRVLLRLASRLVRESCHTSRAVARVRQGTARIELTGSIFCSVRDPVAQPLCLFYAAAVARFMRLFDLDMTVTVAACRGTGAPCCLLAVSPAADRVSAP